MSHDNYFRAIPSLLGTGLIPGAGLAGAAAGEHFGGTYGGAAGAGLGAGLMAAGLAPGGDSLRTGIFSGLGAMGGSLLTRNIQNPVLRGMAGLAAVPLGSLLGRSIADSSRGTAHDAYESMGRDAHKTGQYHAAEHFGVKTAADIIDPDRLSAFRRSGNIDQAWASNAAMGNSSLGNPGMSNPPLTPSLGNLSTAMQWQSVNEGMKLSFMSPPVRPKVRRPAPPTTAGVSGATRGPAPTATGRPPSITSANPIQPRPVTMPGVNQAALTSASGASPAGNMKSVNPANAAADTVRATTTRAMAQTHNDFAGTNGTGGSAVPSPTTPVVGKKLGEFHLEGVGRSASPPSDKLPPDAIRPDNGRTLLGNNFDIPRLGSSDAVSKAFNDLNNAPKNQDFLNEMNQGLIGAGP